MREIRMLRATWRGLETWYGQAGLPARQSSISPPHHAQGRVEGGEIEDWRAGRPA